MPACRQAGLQYQVEDSILANDLTAPFQKETAMPNTVLEDLDKEVLIALVEAKFTAEEIKAMTEPKLRYFAVKNKLDFELLIRARDNMISAQIMSPLVLEDLTKLQQEYNIQLNDLLEISMLILTKADLLGIGDDEHEKWALATFDGYKRARLVTNHDKAMSGVDEEVTPGDYATLRESGIKHKAAIKMMKKYGENVTALSLIDVYASTEEGKKKLQDNLCEFLDTASTPADYEQYLLLKETVSHEHALEVLNRSIMPRRYLSVIDLGISHKNACTLLSLELVRQVFFEDFYFRSQPRFHLDQFVAFGSLRKTEKKLVLKFATRLESRDLA